MKMLPALVLTDKELVSDCLDEMAENGIKAQSKPLAKMAESDIPDWVGDDRDGWLIFIEEDDFEDGMDLLSDMMGYSPEDDYDEYTDEEEDDNEQY